MEELTPEEERMLAKFLRELAMKVGARRVREQREQHLAARSRIPSRLSCLPAVGDTEIARMYYGFSHGFYSAKLFRPPQNMLVPTRTHKKQGYTNENEKKVNNPVFSFSSPREGRGCYNQVKQDKEKTHECV